MIVLKSKLYYPIVVPLFVIFIFLMIYGISSRFDSQLVEYVSISIIFTPVLVLMYLMPRTSKIILSKDDIYIKKWDVLGYGQSEFNILFRNIKNAKFNNKRYTCTLERSDGDSIEFDIRFLSLDGKKLSSSESFRILQKEIMGSLNC